MSFSLNIYEMKFVSFCAASTFGSGANSHLIRLLFLYVNGLCFRAYLFMSIGNGNGNGRESVKKRTKVKCLVCDGKRKKKKIE